MYPTSSLKVVDYHRFTLWALEALVEHYFQYTASERLSKSRLERRRRLEERPIIWLPRATALEDVNCNIRTFHCDYYETRCRRASRPVSLKGLTRPLRG